MVALNLSRVCIIKIREREIRRGEDAAACNLRIYNRLNVRYIRFVGNSFRICARARRPKRFCKSQCIWICVSGQCAHSWPQCVQCEAKEWQKTKYNLSFVCTFGKEKRISRTVCFCCSLDFSFQCLVQTNVDSMPIQFCHATATLA